MTTAVWPGLAVVHTLALALVATHSVDAHSAPDPSGDPKGYAIRIPITPVPDAPLQRLTLPAEALVRLQSPGYADVRIFNAQGQPLATALAQAPRETRTEDKQHQLTAYPILGPATAATSLEGLSLRIEERQGSRVVQLNAPAASSATPRPESTVAQQKVLGGLLDAREVREPAARMVLDADLPAGQPVTLLVQVSKDLRNWRVLTESVLYRSAAPGESGAVLGSASLDLGMADLTGHYVRVSWGDAPVTLRAATLTTSRSTSTRQRVAVAVATPELSGPHAMSLALPFVTPVAALRIVPPPGNTLVPVRILGRNDRNQPWAQLASTVIYRLSGAGKEQVSSAVELSGTPMKEIKIEADSKTAGFSSSPGIELLFEPVQIVFVVSGQGPFILSAGLAAVANAYLPIASLIPGYQPAQESALPVAQAETAKSDISAAAAASGPPVPVPPKEDGIPTRTLVLWGILLTGVLALGAMAWSLLRQTRKPQAQSGGNDQSA